MTPKNPAQKRYRRRFIPAMTLYVAAIVGVSLAFDYFQPHGVLAYALAALPALPIIGVITAMGLYIVEEKDEFEKSVQVEAMLWGIGFTIAVCTTWGLLEIYAGAPRLWVFLVGPIFCAVLGGAQPFIRMRYR